MKSHLFFNILIFCVLLGLFIWQCSLSISKFMRNKTSFYNTIKSKDTILYPSVTVCKKYTYEKNLDYLFHDGTLRLSEIKEEVIKNSLDVEKVFYFFTHPGMLGLTFPCTTNLDGTDPGKPCAFPAKYNNSTFYGCLQITTSSPICFTRVTKNHTAYFEDGVKEFWSYCSDDCTDGQIAHPGSNFNLARRENMDIWSSQFFDLRTWESGLCHTYDPPDKSGQGIQNRLYFLLGYRNMKSDSKMMLGYDIYIHEKGQFWPRSDMQKIGQPDKIEIELNVEMEVSFSQGKIINLHDDESCTEVENYSFTKCLQNYLENKTNCYIEWFTDNLDEKCGYENLFEYYQLLYKIKQVPLKTVFQKSGCYPKCTFADYDYEIKTKNRVDWETNWTSSFYMGPKSSSYTKSVEYYSYDSNDLLGDVGGYLGLFLGWSLLSIFGAVPVFFNKLMSVLGGNRRKKF